MFEEIIKFFKKLGNKKDEQSKGTAKERLHLVLTQDRANISADFLSLMKQEIIEVIKKYIDIDENAIDVSLTNMVNEDGTVGSPTLSASIPIISVKEDIKTENAEKNFVSADKKNEQESSTILDEIIEKHIENSIPEEDDVGVAAHSYPDTRDNQDTSGQMPEQSEEENLNEQ